MEFNVYISMHKYPLPCGQMLTVVVDSETDKVTVYYLIKWPFVVSEQAFMFWCKGKQKQLQQINMKYVNWVMHFNDWMQSNALINTTILFWW